LPLSVLRLSINKRRSGMFAVARVAPPGFKPNPAPPPTRRRARVVVAAASPPADGAEHAAKDDNPYEILGVVVTASKRAVRDAFRAAAKRAHPDTPGGSAKAFDALAKAADVLTDDARRAQVDAVLLDVPAGSLALEELRWSRELAALREAEDAGEVKDPAAVLEAARAYAAAEKALDAIAKRKKKAEDAEKLRRKEDALRASQAARLEITSRVATKGLRGNDVAVTMTVTSEMLTEALEAQSGPGGEKVLDRVTLPLRTTTAVNCSKCDGWGEKEGHWTLALDKLCVKCGGMCRVERTATVRVPLRVDALDGERVVVRGAGDEGYRKQVTALGEMTEPGPNGDLIVTVALLRDGETTRASP